MPAYLVTVVIVYLVYQLHPVDPNPGHTWIGLLRYLTLTQTYTERLHRCPISIRGSLKHGVWQRKSRSTWRFPCSSTDW